MIGAAGALLEVRLVQGSRTRFYTVTSANPAATSWLVERQVFTPSLAEAVDAIATFRQEIDAAIAEGWVAAHRFVLEPGSSVWRPIARDLDGEP